MRDDLAVTNFGQAGDAYSRDFFWRSYRDLEMFLNRLLSKGPVEVSSLTADEIIIGSVTPAAGVVWKSGSGTPEGVVVGAIGSLYTRTDGGAGTTLYVKQSGTGNTGWVGK